MNFQLVSDYKPSGDQPGAIKKLLDGIKQAHRDQVLLGVTGSGKTFTVANVIAEVNKPTLVLSHNKTLAAQLYQEFKEFFPNNAVQYFVSYYDYYQPEAYIPQRDLYIEKDADINEEIDKLRHAATAALLTRSDVIVVASVSCIYNIGSPEEYKRAMQSFNVGMKCTQQEVSEHLVSLLYERNEFDFQRGTFRVRGGNIDVWPAYADIGIRFVINGNTLVGIKIFDPLTGNELLDFASRLPMLGGFLKDGLINQIVVFPAKHHVYDYSKIMGPINRIQEDMEKRVKYFQDRGMILEANRIKQKVTYDIEMIKEVGYCSGIENYSIYFDGRTLGEPPYTLLEYFGEDFLLIVDESHITLPQVRGMYNGDQARKKVLIDYGFRLPTAMDNRPLKFDEFRERQGYTIYMSATPDLYELQLAGTDNVVEQFIRPTGLVDPEVVIRPANGQVKDLLAEIQTVISRGKRVLVTTLTKRMAEELSKYLADLKIKVTYLHSDIDTLERSDILNDLRKGEYDVLVGINLLREGLDLPEVSLVAVLDADKEGFLRSKTSLIQTMGRAARNVDGKVIMYADQITKSMKAAIGEVERRREIQLKYNKEHGIIPKGIEKDVRERILPKVEEKGTKVVKPVGADIDVMVATYKVSSRKDRSSVKKQFRMEMKRAADALDFERAIEIRDLIKKLDS
ncbi:excinuclease ABC subunit UvrB [Candidatus Dojkabacteria bacterium]|nr:excinuclease ABC subunit UvrB [Candidatus Dojkabacteria bacterium]